MKTKLFLFAAMLCVAMTATANNAKISGRIKDANDKSAIIGATVLLMQDTVQIAGTTTDNSGKFTIDAGNGDYILELSYIGYETIRMALTVNGDTHIGDILMQEGATELGEVVVESQAIIQKVDRQILLTIPSKRFLTRVCNCVSTVSRQARQMSKPSIRKILSAWSITTSRAYDTTVRRLWWIILSSTAIRAVRSCLQEQTV